MNLREKREGMMRELSPREKAVLEEIQQDIPLLDRPFQEIGLKIGLTETQLLSSLEDLIHRGYIRDISAIYNAKGLGYKSTLVALSTDFPDETASALNLLSGVSHNYLRDHYFNIWFTLTIPVKQDFAEIIENCLRGERYRGYRILPSLRTFKIGVNFRFKNDLIKKEKNSYSGDVASTSINKDLIRSLQNPFPLISRPWEQIARGLGKNTEVLFTEIAELKKCRVIKRISGVLRHRKAGFAANGMACFHIKEGCIDTAGFKTAEYRAVSHCYERPVYDDWPYSLFAMTHGTSKEACEEVIREIAGDIDALDYLVLYSEKEYKKERMKYFL
jgi:DNA-binding Lrp family transcriptional regulator